MGAKNAAQKKFMDNNSRIADLVNAVFCDGEQLIRAEDLQPDDTALAELVAPAAAEKDRGSVNRTKKERYRDVLKRVTQNMGFLLVGIENQTEIHYAMSARVMVMDALNYEKQLSEYRIGHRKTKDLTEDAEYLSGMSRDERLKPVCTIVMYYGRKPWDASVDLWEILDLNGIPPKLRRMFNGYSMHLIDVRRFQNIGLFQTDLRQIFGFLQHLDNADSLLSYVEENSSIFSSLPEDAYNFLCSVASPRLLKKCMKTIKKTEEGYNVRDELEEIINEHANKIGVAARAEGRTEGIQLTKKAIQLQLLGKSVEEIAKTLKVSIEQAKMMTA